MPIPEHRTQIRVTIDKTLKQELQKEAKEKGFRDLSRYVEYLLVNRV